MMVPFENEVNVETRGIVTGNGEAHRIRAIRNGKASAASPGVTQIAVGKQRGLVRRPRSARNGVANARPSVAERQHSAAGVVGLAARVFGVEVGAGHFGGIVTQDMASTRLEILKSMVEQNPRNSFALYGLAMEYGNSGDLPAAVSAFRALIAADPDYSAAYYHGGQALERLGKSAEARELYLQGIEATTRKGDFHTRDEIQAALDLMA
jgi:tetratricopeptide (TPR) repeat protein